MALTCTLNPTTTLVDLLSWGFDPNSYQIRPGDDVHVVRVFHRPDGGIIGFPCFLWKTSERGGVEGPEEDKASLKRAQAKTCNSQALPSGRWAVEAVGCSTTTTRFLGMKKHLNL